MKRLYAIMDSYFEFSWGIADPTMPRPLRSDTFLQCMDKALYWRQHVSPNVLEDCENWKVDRSIERKRLAKARNDELTRAVPSPSGEKYDVSTETWPALLIAPIRISGLDFTELNTADGLREEGVAMAHCVGSYVNKCINSRIHIVSVTEGLRRLATSSLIVGIYGTVKLLDLRGPRNRSVDLSVLLATIQLVEILNKKTGYLPRRRPSCTLLLPHRSALTGSVFR